MGSQEDLRYGEPHLCQQGLLHERDRGLYVGEGFLVVDPSQAVGADEPELEPASLRLPGAELAGRAVWKAADRGGLPGVAVVAADHVRSWPAGCVAADPGRPQRHGVLDALLDRWPDLHGSVVEAVGEFVGGHVGCTAWFWSRGVMRTTSTVPARPGSWQVQERPMSAASAGLWTWTTVTMASFGAIGAVSGVRSR